MLRFPLPSQPALRYKIVMLRLTLMRHGQSACSARDVLCGRGCDTELTAAGAAQAEAVAEEFKRLDWQAIYTSDLKRALQTAEPLAKAIGQTIVRDHRFDEIDYGTWDGQLASRLARLTGFRDFQQDAAQYSPPGGETASQIAMRAQAALDDLRADCPNGEVLVVSHKTTLRILFCILLGIPLAEYRRRLALPHTCVSVFEFPRSGPRLVRFGYLEHLPEELRGLPGD